MAQDFGSTRRPQILIRITAHAAQWNSLDSTARPARIRTHPGPGTKGSARMAPAKIIAPPEIAIPTRRSVELIAIYPANGGG